MTMIMACMTQDPIALFIIESYYETLLNVIGWYVFDSIGLYLVIEFILPGGWLEILLHIAIYVLFFVLN